MAAVSLLRHNGSGSVSVGELEHLMTCVVHDILLVWDWGMPEQGEEVHEYEEVINNRIPTRPGGPGEESRSDLQRLTRYWNIVQVLASVGDNEEALWRSRQVHQYLRGELGERDTCTLTTLASTTQLCMKSGFFCEAEELFGQVIQMRLRLRGFDFCGVNLFRGIRLETFEMINVPRRGDDIYMTGEETTAVVGSISMDAMKLFLSIRKIRIQVSASAVEAILQTGIGRHVIGKELFGLLLQQGRDKVQIADDVPMALARCVSSWSVEAMELLLALRGDDYRVTEGMITAAAKGEFGARKMRLLLDRKGDEIPSRRMRW